ncbi:MAG: RsmE family RNA methyltransferase [Thermodesulfobacteriota bacterium]
MSEKNLIKISLDEVDSDFVNASQEAIESWKGRPGEIFTVVNPQHEYYRARLTEQNGFKPRLKIFEKIKNPELGTDITLYQAVPEKERMEFIIEKAVELGVSSVVPVITEKSSCIKLRDKKQKKSHNWPVVALKAAKQSRRAFVPEILNEFDFHEAVLRSLNSDLLFFLNESETANKLKNIINGKEINTVSFFSGPEGGFSGNEKQYLAKNNYASATLGSRILRAETAPLAAVAFLSQVLY